MQVKIIKLILIFTIPNLLFINESFGQDYLPLHPGNQWKYFVYDNDIAYSTYDVEIIDSFELDTLGYSLTVYPWVRKWDGSAPLDSISYYYTIEGESNKILYCPDYDQILNITIEMFRHQYFEGDTLDEGYSKTVSNFHGEYITTEGLSFNNCWKLTDLNNNYYYIVAPNIGTIAYILLDTLEPFDYMEITEYFIDEQYLSTDSPSTIDEISIYPNPAHSIINIQNKSIDSSLKIIIYNPIGIPMYKSFLDTELTIDISSFNNGFYYISYYNNNKIIGTSRFVKIE